MKRPQGPLDRSYALKTDSNPYPVTLNLNHFAEVDVTQHPALGEQIRFSITGERYHAVTISRVDPVEFMDREFSRERGWSGEEVGAPQISNASITTRPAK